MSRWKEFCPKCINYEENAGVCSELHFNVKNYPKKFTKKCEGRFFRNDSQKGNGDIPTIETSADNQNNSTFHQSSNNAAMEHEDYTLHKIMAVYKKIIKPSKGKIYSSDLSQEMLEKIHVQIAPGSEGENPLIF